MVVLRVVVVVVLVRAWLFIIFFYIHFFLRQLVTDVYFIHCVYGTDKNEKNGDGIASIRNTFGGKLLSMFYSFCLHFHILYQISSSSDRNSFVSSLNETNVISWDREAKKETHHTHIQTHTYCRRLKFISYCCAKQPLRERHIKPIMYPL